MDSVFVIFPTTGQEECLEDHPKTCFSDTVIHNHGNRKSCRLPGVVRLPNGRTSWRKKWGVILTTYNTSGRFPSPFLAKAAANASKSVLLVETNLWYPQRQDLKTCFCWDFPLTLGEFMINHHELYLENPNNHAANNTNWTELGIIQSSNSRKKNSETKKTHTQILVNTTRCHRRPGTCSIHSHDGSMERTAYGISTDPWNGWFFMGEKCR